MYKREFKRFLQYLGIDKKNVQDCLKTHGLRTPEDTLLKLFPALEPQETSALHSLFELDSQSGYHQHYLHAAITGLAHYYAQGSGVPLGIVEFDYENNKETKKILGTERMNEVFRLVNGMIVEEIRAQNPDFCYPTRINVQGDEFRIITIGMTQQDLNKACQRAKQRIEAFSLKAGLYDLKHPKKPHISSARGFSVGFGVAMVDGTIKNEFELKCKLEHDIHNDKFLSGVQREKAIKRKKLEGALISPFVFTDPDKVLNRKESLYLDFVLASAKDCVRKPAADYLDACPEGLYNTKRAAFETVTETAHRQAKPGSLYRKLIELRYQKDPLSGAEPLLYLVQDWVNLLNDLKNQGRKGVCADFELRNLPGMNDYLGGENTDFVIAHAARMLHNALGLELGEGNFKIHTSFGGRFKILSFDDSIDRIKKALLKVQAEIDRDINRKAVCDYFPSGNIHTDKSLVSLQDVPNSLYRGRKGIYAGFAVTPVMPDLSAEEHLSLLENKIQPEIKQALWGAPPKSTAKKKTAPVPKL